MEKAPILLPGYKEQVKQRNADHQYYLEQFVEWLNKNYWTGLGSYNIPLKDVQALLKEAGGE